MPRVDFTAQKMKFSIKDFFSKFDQILNGKLYFLCSVWRRKLKKDARFLNQQKKRNEAKIEKMSRSNKVSLSRDIDQKLNDILISSKSEFDANFPKYLLWEQQRKQCQLKSKKSMR